MSTLFCIIWDAAKHLTSTPFCIICVQAYLRDPAKPDPALAEQPLRGWREQQEDAGEAAQGADGRQDHHWGAGQEAPGAGCPAGEVQKGHHRPGPGCEPSTLGFQKQNGIDETKLVSKRVVLFFKAYQLFC